jgi:dihydrodipicolinate synthase/N-acetylneuraminate lyase
MGIGGRQKPDATVIAELAYCIPEFMGDFYATWQKGDFKLTAQTQLEVMKARKILKLGQTLTLTYAILRKRGIDPDACSGFEQQHY